MERRRRPSTRWIAVLASMLLAVGGSAVPSVHRLLVPHRLCSVHGSWEHLGETGQAESGPLLVAGANDLTDSGPALRASDEPHDACPFGIFARTESSPDGIGAPRTHTRRTEPLPQHVSGERAHSSVPLLSLAPKQSPPA